MPELPEVETLCRELNKVLIKKVIQSIEVKDEKTIKPLSAKSLQTKLVAKKITGVRRRAKVIIIDLSDKNHLVIHLKMTGQLIYEPTKGYFISGGHINPPDKNLPDKFTRLVINFKNKDKLYFNDMRKFGWVKHLNQKETDKLFEKLGPEPLSKEFTINKFTAKLQKHPRKNIKQFLLDQEKIAGLGNIYVDESLFLTGINPNRKIEEINKKKITKLYQNIKEVLRSSIKQNGTTFKDYRRSDGQTGNFSDHLKVYGRKDKKCLNCKNKIIREKIAGRGTHFCPQCQK